MPEQVSAIAFDFNFRANLAEYPEWMDQPCSYEELRGCLRSIAQVNRLTRAYYPTRQWLSHVYSVLPRQEKPLHIVDVGCGYGDMLRCIDRWAADRSFPVRLTGIDLNPDAVRAAREATMPGKATFLSGNAYDFKPPEGIDIVISSLMTHHLQNREIVEFLNWMESTVRIGWFINDLHREKVSYYAFKAISRLMPWHPFVKHDGAVSILRGFRQEDWRGLLKAAAIPEKAYLLKEYRPARLCVARLR